MIEHELTESEVDALQAGIERLERMRTCRAAKLKSSDMTDEEVSTLLGVTPAIPASRTWDGAMFAADLAISKFGWGFILRDLAPINGSPAKWRAEFFDGDPIICNGIGGVQNHVEFHNDAIIGPLAICRAIVGMHETVTKKVKP